MKKIIWKFNTNFKYMIWYNFLNRLKKFHLIAKNVVLLVQTTHDNAYWLISDTSAVYHQVFLKLSIYLFV